jgi:uncharacterized RDD family membrane protein YckC
MHCQHCDTWVLDDEHRCPRCGRRVRSWPVGIARTAYPVNAAATAPKYDYIREPSSAEPVLHTATEPETAAQQQLFATPWTDPRVIPFESLTTQAERESIRARAAGLSRPDPVKTGKVEARHLRPKKSRSENQRRFDFLGEQEVFSQPQCDILCDAPVAPPLLRLQAALVDGVLITIGCLPAFAFYIYSGGPLALDKHVLPFLVLLVLTVSVFYRLLWAIAGSDTPGMRSAGLELMDFDGHRPSPARRYQRFLGGWISLLAAGIGLIWALVDQDGLTWHDHISSTFPTIRAESDDRASLA